MQYQSASLVYWMKHASDRVIIPASVDIDLTNLCNQDCFYCNSADHREQSPGGPHYSTYIELLDRLASWRQHSPHSVGSLHTVTYPGGGEPTLLKGFEHVIEHTIDLGFLTALTTNGYKLDQLIKTVPGHKLKKMAWIGVDIDAGNKKLYEQIRRTKTGRSIFDRVVENAKNMVKLGVNLDFKILLCEPNLNAWALREIFELSSQVKARILYFRPAIINGQAVAISPEIQLLINDLSVEFNQPIKFNFSKSQTRNYSRCHQMFQFPVFCADGHIYVCCDNKGNPRFSIGRWDQGDFRDVWLNSKHHDIYSSTNTHLCPPCRPNKSNIAIQNVLDDPQQLETLYL